MSTPAIYYKMRADNLKELKQNVVNKVYETYYKLLTSGEINGKNTQNKLLLHYPPNKKQVNLHSKHLNQ